MDVKNKVVLMTGGLGGIGLALGKELLRNGIKGITLLDISVNSDLVEELASEFTKDRVLVIKTDVTKQNEVEDAFEATVAKYKQLDIVVNCAGVICKHDFEKELAINYIAAYKITMMSLEKYLPKYRSGDEGVIINFSSIAALDPGPITENYSATKSALLTLSRSLACGPYSKKYKVKFLILCPGTTVTPLLLPLQDFEMANEILKDRGTQSPEEHAKEVVRIIEKFENGDVYVIEDKESFKIKFLNRFESRE